MKALSIRQPFAWAILHAGKRIENRVWSACHYRGPLLIHASSGFGTRVEFDSDVEVLCSHVSRARVRTEVAEMVVGLRGASHGEGFWRPRPELLRGGIVGVCNLVDVIDRGAYVSRAAPSDPAQSIESPWYMGQLGLVLDDVRPLPFTPLKGALGLFDVVGDTPEQVIEIAGRR